MIKMNKKAKTITKSNKKCSCNDEICMVDEHDEEIGSMSMEEAIASNLLHRRVIIFIFNDEGDIYFCKNSSKDRLFPNKFSAGCNGYVKSNETYEECTEWLLNERFSITAPASFVRRVRLRDQKINYLGHVYCLCYEDKIKCKDCSGKFVPESKINSMIVDNEIEPDIKAILVRYLGEIKEIALS